MKSPREEANEAAARLWRDAYRIRGEREPGRKFQHQAGPWFPAKCKRVLPHPDLDQMDGNSDAR